MILIGAASFVVGAMLILAPLLLGRRSLNRYIVAVGLLGAFTGMSLMLHGAWDLLRERRG